MAAKMKTALLNSALLSILLFLLFAGQTLGQTYSQYGQSYIQTAPPQPVSQLNQVPLHKHALVQANMAKYQGPQRIWRSKLDRPKSQGSVDVMDIRNFTLIDYRKMFSEARTPAPHELVGQWKGVNKGIVEIAGYRQFIKEITPQTCSLKGDNILVHQVSNDLLRAVGWQPISGTPQQNYMSREGSFAVEPPSGLGPFKHGAVFSYRRGDNKPTDPARVLVDKLVVLDSQHLLGRATAEFGPIKIPLAYFTLERIQQPLMIPRQQAVPVR